jgi:hypothetical protein
MADNEVNVVFSADTSGLQAGLNAVNQALAYTKIAANDTKNPVAELFGTMQKSSDQAVAGIIKGTQSWQQAVFNIAQSLEIQFAQLAVNRLLNDTVADALGLKSAQSSDAAKVASNAAKNATITASDQAASATSIGAQVESAIASILNDAKQVFAGIFAFLSPTMGPAAVGPAAAGSATVAALASGITYAESGAWNIPSNTLAYLHAGEMVVPQSFASSLRDNGGLGGGGDSYTININAIDTQTGAQFLKNNASVIASTLSSQARNFNRNIPAWKS